MKRDYNRVEAIVKFCDIDGYIEFTEVNCDMRELHCIDRSGIEEWITYDEYGNSISMIRSNGVGTTWEYDEHNNLIKYNSTIFDGADYEHYEYQNTYDENGRLVKVISHDDGYIRYIGYNDRGDRIFNNVKFTEGDMYIDIYVYDYENDTVTIQFFTDDINGFSVKSVTYDLIKYQYGWYDI